MKRRNWSKITLILFLLKYGKLNVGTKHRSRLFQRKNNQNPIKAFLQIMCRTSISETPSKCLTRLHNCRGIDKADRDLCLLQRMGPTRTTAFPCIAHQSRNRALISSVPLRLSLDLPTLFVISVFSAFSYYLSRLNLEVETILHQNDEVNVHNLYNSRTLRPTVIT